MARHDRFVADKRHRTNGLVNVAISSNSQLLVGYTALTACDLHAFRKLSDRRLPVYGAAFEGGNAGSVRKPLCGIRHPGVGESHGLFWLQSAGRDRAEAIAKRTVGRRMRGMRPDQQAISGCEKSGAIFRCRCAHYDSA